MNKPLELRDEIMALEKRKAGLRQEIELLEREQKELADSNSDIRKRLLDGKEDITDVEKKHLTSIQVYEERSVALLDEIIARQESLKSLLRSLSTTENILGETQKKADKKEKELAEIECAFEEKVAVGNEDVRILAERLCVAEGHLALAKTELETAQKENIAVRHDTEQRIQKCEKEERLISVRRSDLEIYELRLRKQYPDATMVFTT